MDGLTISQSFSDVIKKNRRVKTNPYNGNKPERGNSMSGIGIIVKTIVKVIYGIVKLFGIIGEGMFKLSNVLNDSLTDLDEKLTE